MSEKPLAYVGDDGDMVVIDAFDSEVHVPLMRITEPGHIVQQLWRLSTKNNYESEALKQAIEIMSKQVGLPQQAYRRQPQQQQHGHQQLLLRLSVHLAVRRLLVSVQ